MIYLNMHGHDYKYEIEDILRLFFNNLEVEITDSEPDQVSEEDIYIFSSISGNENNYLIKTIVKVKGKFESINEKPLELNIEGTFEMDSLKTRKKLKWELKRELYLALSRYTSRHLPWGISTGVRPAKLVQEMLDSNYIDEHILKKLEEYYLMSHEKASLLLSVARTERKILNSGSPEKIGLYIGIPFCTTRCLYCSFTSNPISAYKKLIGSYLSALKNEIHGISKLIWSKKLIIQSIYIGGGTPTSIDNDSLRELLYTVENELDLSMLEEYTLEAGRPDSISINKLETIKNSRVDRISINPQSMNQKTLDIIGRRHSPDDVIYTFREARRLGFYNINMDVIAGLPGENLDMFRNTLDNIIALDPESLTVHTMAVKAASRLKEEKDMHQLISSDEAGKMVDLSQEYAARLGMIPYYLYRQKNMVGNLENVGFCKPGHESIYNVQIMEEKQTIIAAGAGAVTKVVYPDSNRIERAFNVKSVEEYIQRLDEMLSRKAVLIDNLG